MLCPRASCAEASSQAGTAPAISTYKENFMIEGLLQPMHLLVILAVAIFVLGPKKLPELGKGLAEGIRSFQKGVKEATDPEKKS
jgi:sec-independent protein translocase protein TatA